MHVGIVMEGDYRYGSTQEEAFRDAFTLMEMAEEGGLSGIWLAERHFAAPKATLDYMGTGIPSIVSTPLILAGAMAARTERVRIGVAVNVLPLLHPIRMAEEVATVDQISQGRFEFGVGRSGFARAYEGYDVPYSESRERFQECLEIILSAWTQERFSYEGQYYTFNDIHVLPKPYQKPYPPLRVAATTRDTFPQVGAAGYPIFVGLRGMDRPDLAHYLKVYRDAWREAGHAGNGDVYLRLPIYVAATAERARSEPEESTMHSYRRLAQSFGTSAASVGAVVSEERSERSERLSKVTYDDLLRDRLAYGTPEAVITQIKDMQEELQLSGVIAEINVGGLNTQDKVLDSLCLFTQEVVPALG